jgi:hypothetical protein
MGFLIISIENMKKEIDWQVCQGLQTRIYRNLGNGLMSLTQQINKSWLLVGHTSNVAIEYPKFYVSEAGRQRVIREHQKNVHAWATGRLLTIAYRLDRSDLKQIYYCPYTQPYFSWLDSKEQIVSADLLIVIDNQVFCTSNYQQPQLTLFGNEAA